MRFSSLNAASPLITSLASLIVIVLPTCERLEAVTTPSVSPPVSPLRLVTPVAPGQVEKLRLPPVPDTRQRPAVVVLTEVSAPVPCPKSTPFVAKEVRPVPPLATLSADVRVRPAKVGAAPILISCTVFTLPFRTAKLVPLNDARPFTLADASLIIIDAPVESILVGSRPAIVTAPVLLLRLVTPPAPGHDEKLSSPKALETRHWFGAEDVSAVTADVPFPISTPFCVKLVVPVPP